MTRLLSSPLTYLVGSLLLLAGVLFVLSMIHLRQARRGSYWRMRRTAGQRGGQLFLVSVTLFGIALVIAFFSGFLAIAVDEFNDFLFGREKDPFPGIAFPTATFTPNFPTPDVEGTLANILTATADSFATQSALTESAPLPTDTPTVTPTPSPTGTLTATPTLSPTPTFDMVLDLTPPASTVQPRDDAVIGITAAAAGISTDQTPIDPAESFDGTIERLYFFIDFQNMENGTTWSRILYREGVPIQGGSYSWTLGESGSSFFFFGHEGGYPPGNYEVRVFLGVAEVSRFRFTVVSAAQEQIH